MGDEKNLGELMLSISSPPTTSPSLSEGAISGGYPEPEEYEQRPRVYDEDVIASSSSLRDKIVLLLMEESRGAYSSGQQNVPGVISEEEARLLVERVLIEEG